MQVEFIHHLCLAWGCLIEATLQANSGCSLCQVWDHLTEGTLQVEIGHPLCWAWGFLGEAAMYAKSGHCLCEVCWFFTYMALVDLWESLQCKPKVIRLMWALQTFEWNCSMRSCRQILWRSHWKILAGWASWMRGWWGSQGITRTVQMVLSRLIESTYLTHTWTRLTGWK